MPGNSIRHHPIQINNATRNHFRQAGLTLLELLITLSIVSILSMAALPGYSELMRKNELNNYSRDFYHFIQFARHHSVTSHHNVTVCGAKATVDVKNDNAKCEKSTADSELLIAYTDGPEHKIIRVFPLSDRINLNTTIDKVTFQPSGQPLKEDIKQGNRFHLCAMNSEIELSSTIEIKFSGNITYTRKAPSCLS